MCTIYFTADSIDAPLLVDRDSLTLTLDDVPPKLLRVGLNDVANVDNFTVKYIPVGGDTPIDVVTQMVSIRLIVLDNNDMRL